MARRGVKKHLGQQKKYELGKKDKNWKIRKNDWELEKRIKIRKKD